MARSINRRTLLQTGALAAFGIGSGITLAACSDNNGGGGSGGGGGGELDTSEAVTITMLVLGDKPTNGRLEAMLEQLNAKLTEKVNASLELFYIEWADWQTQYNVQLLSGDDNVDLIGTATDWLFAWENAQKGAFLPMDEAMLSSYAPKTWAQVDADGHWELCKLPDGMIYFMPEDNYTQWTNHGFFYRGDWATEAGIPDGTITKFEEFTTYFQWVKDNQPEAYPWDVAGANEAALTGWVQGRTDYQTVQQVTAGIYAPFHTREGDLNTVTSYYMESDELIAAAENAKKWNDIGVWREDAINYDGDTRELFYAGLSGADQHHMQTFLGILHRMPMDQPGSDPKFFYWGTENNNYFRDIKTHGAMAVSANSRNPERALAVYDLLRNDEECYHLLNYGIEGTDYVIDDDGRRAEPEGFDAATDALGSNFWYGRMDELEIPSATEPENKQELFDALDANAKDYPYERLVVDKTVIDSTLAAMGAVLSEYIPQLQYGKFDDPAAAIAEMRQKLTDAGYEDARASIQADIEALGL